MSTVYWKADDTVVSFVDSVMALYHNELKSAKVKIGIIFAYSGSENKPSVRHAGYPAYATIKLISLKDRISKGYDAELLIDADNWKTSCDKSRAALIDHELSHLQLKKKKVKKNKKESDENESDDEEIHNNSEIEIDDIGRPILKIRKGDWNVGDGFRDVVARHGEYSVEAQSIESATAFVNSLISSVKVDGE